MKVDIKEVYKIMLIDKDVRCLQLFFDELVWAKKYTNSKHLHVNAEKKFLIERYMGKHQIKFL